jgi:hypothetical protein
MPSPRNESTPLVGLLRLIAREIVKKLETKQTLMKKAESKESLQ